mmetsp:Transcript_72647/g.224666  ORF Transcript_72647/g.224666 Transcript_72647/m.224666 type:complete len:239 (+) Transcript_72647:222-938(+)
MGHVEVPADFGLLDLGHVLGGCDPLHRRGGLLDVGPGAAPVLVSLARGGAVPRGRHLLHGRLLPRGARGRQRSEQGRQHPALVSSTHKEPLDAVAAVHQLAGRRRLCHRLCGLLLLECVYCSGLLPREQGAAGADRGSPRPPVLPPWRSARVLHEQGVGAQGENGRMVAFDRQPCCAHALSGRRHRRPHRDSQREVAGGLPLPRRLRGATGELGGNALDVEVRAVRSGIHARAQPRHT